MAVNFPRVDRSENRRSVGREIENETKEDKNGNEKKKRKRKETEGDRRMYIYRGENDKGSSPRLKPSFSLPFGPPWRLVTLKTSRRPTSRQNDLSTYWQGNAHNHPSISSLPANRFQLTRESGLATTLLHPPRESTLHAESRWKITLFREETQFYLA